MAGILSGLEGLGLKNLESLEIYDEHKEEKLNDVKKEASPTIKEKDLVYDRSFKCPVCDSSITAKIMKTGKAKLLGMDDDLRPKYEGIDIVKYDVVLCEHCGYAALTRYFPTIGSGQARMIMENISKNVSLRKYGDDIYTYEQAIERYKLALVNAIVKKAKSSEKAYICLKSAWVLRGYREELEGSSVNTGNKIAELKEQEEEYLKNAFEGFVDAVSNESFPMCGMDEITVDFIMAQLAYHLKKYDYAAKLISSILTSSVANARTKDKARDLKDKILAELKK